ncbi:MAG TPA: twin-arginine translocase subunit TatC [Acidimicrobiia bacterium]|nr:twin-arginine translocase subunit TatC [Acidimicrobiia bacterium]
MNKSKLSLDDKARMSFFSHLLELRRRLVISIAAVIVGTILGYIIAPWVIRWIADFYIEASQQRGARLTQTTVLDGFVLRIKVATYIGIVFACPVWLFQLWRFITPGLSPKEKKYAIPFISASIILFLLGGTLSLFTLTKALSFLLNSGGVEYFQVIGASSYVSFVVLMFLAFGISFEFPVVLVFLLIAKIIKTSQLRSFRRGALLIIVIFAAVITPSQDPYSLFLMVIPMYAFYEASIIVGRILKR